VQVIYTRFLESAQAKNMTIFGPTTSGVRISILSGVVNGV
jgi:hypothetical protein